MIRFLSLLIAGGGTFYSPVSWSLEVFQVHQKAITSGSFVLGERAPQNFTQELKIISDLVKIPTASNELTFLHRFLIQSVTLTVRIADTSPQIFILSPEYLVMDGQNLDHRQHCSDLPVPILESLLSNPYEVLVHPDGNFKVMNYSKRIQKLAPMLDIYPILQEVCVFPDCTQALPGKTWVDKKAARLMSGTMLIPTETHWRVLDVSAGLMLLSSTTTQQIRQPVSFPLAIGLDVPGPFAIDALSNDPFAKPPEVQVNEFVSEGTSEVKYHCDWRLPIFCQTIRKTRTIQQVPQTAGPMTISKEILATIHVISSIHQLPEVSVSEDMNKLLMLEK